MDKYECFNSIKEILESKGCHIDNKKEISYGLQFQITYQQQKGVYRIYQGKKGLRLDSSQIKDSSFRQFIDNIIEGSFLIPSNNQTKNQNKELCHDYDGNDIISQDPQQIIGIDESGKGDYFGPLVIAGVYVDEKTSTILKKAGVTDSKKIQDTKINKLAKIIKDNCPYDIVIISNERYNELYDSIKNLNKLLAWGHARVIENLLERVDCKFALSDQFGKPELLQEALMSKGRKIQLMQKTKAEENIAVAAASILARNTFVEKISELELQYQIELPKGASMQVITAAKKFVQQYGFDAIKKVAKVHFKITNQID